MKKLNWWFIGGIVFLLSGTVLFIYLMKSIVETLLK